MTIIRDFVLIVGCLGSLQPILGDQHMNDPELNSVTNPRFGHTNETHMSIAHSDVTRYEYMSANVTKLDDYILLMFDEIVMARDEEDGILKYIEMLGLHLNGPNKAVDVLEIGFGMGISGKLIQENGCSLHTIIEANSNVMKSLVDWKIGMAGPSQTCLVTPMFGFWEDVMPMLRGGSYGAVMYDPHPSIATVPFLREAWRVLQTGGKLVFFLAVYDNVSVPMAWNHMVSMLLTAGWSNWEIGTPVIHNGLVMADCGHKYSKPGPTKECPFRNITYIIPNITKTPLNPLPMVREQVQLDLPNEL